MDGHDRLEPHGFFLGFFGELITQETYRDLVFFLMTASEGALSYGDIQGIPRGDLLHFTDRYLRKVRKENTQLQGLELSLPGPYRLRKKN